MSQTFRSCCAGISIRGMVIGASLAAAALVGATQSFADPVSPEGFWYTKGNESIIKFQPCKQTFCGSVVWLKDPNDRQRRAGRRQQEPRRGQARQADDRPRDLQQHDAG